MCLTHWRGFLWCLYWPFWKPHELAFAKTASTSTTSTPMGGFLAVVHLVKANEPFQLYLLMLCCVHWDQCPYKCHCTKPLSLQGGQWAKRREGPTLGRIRETRALGSHSCLRGICLYVGLVKTWEKVREKVRLVRVWRVSIQGVVSAE